MQNLDATHRAILDHCADGFAPITSVTDAVDVSRSTLYRKKDKLLDAGLIEERDRDGAPGSEYRTTEQGEQVLAAAAADGPPAPPIPVLDRAPTREHQATIELVLAACAARQSKVTESHHPWFLLAGKTLKWKTWTAKFCAHLLGVEPDDVITLMSTETGRSIFRRKGYAGETVSENPLLSRPLACLDEMHEARDEVLRDARAYLQGERTLLDEGDPIEVEPVAIVTMNFPEEAGEGTLAARTPFDEAQLRRAVAVDFDQVTIPDAEKPRGDAHLDAAQAAEPVSLPADCEHLDVSETVAAVIDACLTDAAGPVDHTLLEVLASGMTAFYGDERDALARALEDWLWLAATRGWTADDWQARLREILADHSGAGGEPETKTERERGAAAETAALAPQDPTEEPTGGKETERELTTEQEVFQLVLHERMPPEEIVARGIASGDEVEAALETLDRLTEYDVVAADTLEEMLRAARRDGYDEGYDDAREKYRVEYPCNVCGEPIELTNSSAKEALFDFLKEASETHLRAPDWNWGHTSCHEDNEIRADGGREREAEIPPDNLREKYYVESKHVDGDSDRGLTVSPEIERYWEVLDELKAKKEDEKATLQSIEERKRTAQREHEELTAENEALREENAELEAEHQELEEALTETREALANVREVLDETEYDTIPALAAAVTEWHEAEATIDDLEAAISEKEDDLAAVEEELADTEARLDDLQAEIDRWIEQREHAETLEDYARELQRHIDELDAKLEEKTERHNTLVDEINEQRRRWNAEYEEKLDKIEDAADEIYGAFQAFLREAIEQNPPHFHCPRTGNQIDPRILQQQFGDGERLNQIQHPDKMRTTIVCPHCTTSKGMLGFTRPLGGGPLANETEGTHTIRLYDVLAPTLSELSWTEYGGGTKEDAEQRRQQARERAQQPAEDGGETAGTRDGPAT